MKKIVMIVIFTFIVILVGCSNDSRTITGTCLRENSYTMTIGKGYNYLILNELGITVNFEEDDFLFYRIYGAISSSDEYFEYVLLSDNIWINMWFVSDRVGNDLSRLWIIVIDQENKFRFNVNLNIIVNISNHFEDVTVHYVTPGNFSYALRLFQNLWPTFSSRIHDE